MRRFLTGSVGVLIVCSGCLVKKPESKPSADVKKTEPFKAAVGVGKQGQSLAETKGPGKIVAQPAKTLFAVKQKIVFEIQIPQAMNLHKAQFGNPKTHDEFMEEIIKMNKIKLPELPAGQQYVYHPDTAELWVHPDDG